jgi:prepilin-type N-terminal cleavage/methylation domain-containing protein
MKKSHIIKNGRLFPTWYELVMAQAKASNAQFISASLKTKTQTQGAKGFTLTELLVTIGIIGTLAGLLLPAVARAKSKANRVICLNNVSQIGKALIAFAADNSDRFPWQLTPSANKVYFGTQDANSVTAIVSTAAMKSELGNPALLMSPCDPEAQEPNEKAQSEWGTYNTLRGKMIACAAVSYRFGKGATPGRPGTLLGVTRNLSAPNILSAWFVGADETEIADQAMAGLFKSQGHGVLADGSARQMNDTDLKVIAKTHRESSGGTYIGAASTEIIGCCAGVDSSDMLAKYPMNGDFRDYSGNGYHLSAKILSPISDRMGQAGKAYEFRSDALSPKFPMIHGNFSYAFWVNPKRNTPLIPESTRGMRAYFTDQQYVIFPNHGGGGNNAGVGVSVGKNGVQVVEHKHCYMPAVISWRAKLNGWTHVAVVIDDHVPTLYVNGKMVRRGVKSGKNTFLSGVIGCGYIQYGRFYGELDDMIFYARSLTSQEVTRIYQTNFRNQQTDPAIGN